MKKNLGKGILLLMFMMIYSGINLKAQDEEKKSPFSVGADLVSSYVWRGSKIGSGPNIQPSLKYNTGGLTLGAWGSFSFHDGGDVRETDLYGSYAFDFGLSLGLTDYYYQGFPIFNFSEGTSSHALEINLAYSIEKLSLYANYILNDASLGGPANKPGGGDTYFEANYNFKNFAAFAGAGNGWHTSYKTNGDDVFAVCHLGIKSGKEIKVSETFSIPVTGALSINPDKEQLNFVVGFSF